MTAKTLALVIGVIFIAVGLLGFVSNPVIGESPDAIFHADATHNYVHIVSGVLFVLVALAAPAFSGSFMKIFGIIYLAIGIMGLVKFGTDGMGELFGFLHVNGPDNLLHIGLGVVIFLAGFARTRNVLT
jgi:hypothetical protein